MKYHPLTFAQQLYYCLHFRLIAQWHAEQDSRFMLWYPAAMQERTRVEWQR